MLRQSFVVFEWLVDLEHEATDAISSQVKRGDGSRPAYFLFLFRVIGLASAQRNRRAPQ
jgi:hypothetical protein